MEPNGLPWRPGISEGITRFFDGVVFPAPRSPKVQPLINAALATAGLSGAPKAAVLCVFTPRITGLLFIFASCALLSLCRAAQ